MFKRILIANRGEIALRVIRACRKLGVESVAVYSEADSASPHLSEADGKVCIGPGKSTESYLNMTAIIQAAEQTECCAVHPGYGFLAENALFAELCEQAKITFIGPPAQAIRAMGDKATARETMRQAGLPVIPGSRGTLTSVEEGLQSAERIGFPVLLKASAGGGGRGMRRVDGAGEFESKYREASMEAEKAFGNDALYMEKYIVDGRHIEFQVMADAFGNVVHLAERECSVQRRHQKLIEESPSPVVDQQSRREMGERLRSAMAIVGYRSAGTVEFLRDSAGQLFFMEVNARLQVEHPVTEEVTGHDLVSEQILIAANETLRYAQEQVKVNGHAIECRINAENPDDDFQPSPGEVTQFSAPTEVSGVKVRVDTHVQPGYRIPMYYDSLIAKLIVSGPTRAAAREGMIKALESFHIGGVKTTVPVLIKVLKHPDFAAGAYDTGLIGRLLG
ncbi:MAG: acetyl-CoA carboxylase biotin carboxylase subunit [Phycisphaerae bacterium]